MTLPIDEYRAFVAARPPSPDGYLFETPRCRFWPEPAADAPPRVAAAEDPENEDRASASTALDADRIALDPAVPAGTEAAVAGGWPLVAADEFDAPALDPAFWFPYTGGAAGGNGSGSEDSPPADPPMRQTSSSGFLRATRRAASMTSRSDSLPDW